MTPDKALSILDSVLKPNSLNNIQERVFQRIWEGQTYEQIANDLSYDCDYIKHVGSKLFLLLSKALKQKVTKSNFHSILRKFLDKNGTIEPYPASAGVIKTNSSTKENQHQNLRSVKLTKTRFVRASQQMTVKQQQDWGDSVNVSVFYACHQELTRLQQWIVQDNCRLLVLFGVGGIGKTVLSVKLGQQVQEHFEFVIWRSLRNAPTLETLLSDLVSFVSNFQEDKASLERLIHYLRSSRCLLILDDVENILAADAVGQYRPGYERYGELFRVISEIVHSSCLILTTREKLTDLASLEGVDLAVRSFRLNGSNEVALALLEEKKLVGSPNQKQTLCYCYSNNPLNLKIIATLIQNLYDGEINMFLKQNILLVRGIRKLIEQQFSCLTPLEKSIMYYLAINQRWITINELEENITLLLFRGKLLEALEKLWNRSMVKKQVNTYRQEPVIVEYITEYIVERLCEEIITDKLDLLTSQALFKNTSNSILKSTTFQLYSIFKSQNKLEFRLIQLLVKLQTESYTLAGYGVKNLVGILMILWTKLCCDDDTEKKLFLISNIALTPDFLSSAELSDSKYYNTFIEKLE